jgi:hypothetical protein
MRRQSRRQSTAAAVRRAALTGAASLVLLGAGAAAASAAPHAVPVQRTAVARHAPPAEHHAPWAGIAGAGAAVLVGLVPLVAPRREPDGG